MATGGRGAISQTVDCGVVRKRPECVRFARIRGRRIPLTIHGFRETFWIRSLS